MDVNYAGKKAAVKEPYRSVHTMWKDWLFFISRYQFWALGGYRNFW